jgi:L-alanine-DL-glutamate epimerase-like enolase superfamily enzyme
VGGVITLDDRPGLGMQLDESKIEEQQPLSWSPTRWS